MTDWTNSDLAEGRSYCPEIVLYLDGKCGPKITRFHGLDFSFLNVWLVSEIGLRRIRRKTALRSLYPSINTGRQAIFHFFLSLTKAIYKLGEEGDQGYRSNRQLIRVCREIFLRIRGIAGTCQAPIKYLFQNIQNGMCDAKLNWRLDDLTRHTWDVPVDLNLSYAAHAHSPTHIILRFPL